MLSPQGAKKFHIENAIAYIDQLDKHAPLLTVNDTFEFAFRCKAGGTHIEPAFVKTAEQRAFVRELDRDRSRVNFVLEALGLSHVKDTFVGNETVRGVSGGQRRRVTVGEMIVQRTPVLCGDEISTGLDAASTYDMVQVLLHLGKLQKMIRVLALLQPSPETVSLFDEVILLAEGKVLYAGPIAQVEEYFASLGYYAPEHVDVADFLQALSTPDAGNLFDPPPAVKATRSTPYKPDELAEIFRNSKLGRKIEADVNAPTQHVWKNRAKASAQEEFELQEGVEIQFFKRKYNNRILWSTWLNLKRGLILWMRDTRVIIANTAKNVIMGVSVGGVFFQTDNVVSILGVFFQATLFIMLGTNLCNWLVVNEDSLIIIFFL
jgi:ABC-type multidrug transport system ATPase subunit